jgi:putative holliday junction resolvase
LNSDLPKDGRIAAIDYGSVRHGIAICDPSQHWVTPFDTYVRRNEKLDREFFASFVKREMVQGFVIGLPIHCDGKESQKSEEVRKFCDWLGKVTELPMALYDERFSTAEARTLLRDSGLTSAQKKERLDRLAAYLILSGFLESRRRGDSQNEALDDGGHTP